MVLSQKTNMGIQANEQPSDERLLPFGQWLWWKTLKRRSQKHNMTWRRMEHLTKKWLPPVRVYHPYPLVRFGVIT